MADRLIYDIEFKGVDAGKKSLEEITKLQIAKYNFEKLSKLI